MDNDVKKKLTQLKKEYGKTDDEIFTVVNLDSGKQVKTVSIDFLFFIVGKWNDQEKELFEELRNGL